MRVRDWDDIVNDVVDADVDPDGWRAVSGNRANGIGEDFYLGHPRAGVYQLKTYAKNPFQVRGVGTRVARRIDDDLDAYLPTEADGRFAVQSGAADEDDADRKARDLQEVVRAHADAPTTPGDLFDDAMEAVESPAFGPLEHDGYGRPGALDDLSESFEEADDVLNAELDDLIETDDVGKSFR